ncbi:conserved protein of unknown function [Rhodovastum atsumiense]|uniref:Alpha/beta hydrolase n=1 Tax=Rhodovastum atsumiense TaxID=504468 RepID=A0A5M6IS05_9PROT|nr:hypothetical protein [Rhodovastum atsumiense]KAA5611080.1 hypothetical protein F1189_15905 [Rhodovastum atsumiense]CAH2599140.1 conserved protein of unknown function [Rhodovastum atsumiense]
MRPLDVLPMRGGGRATTLLRRACGVALLATLLSSCAGHAPALRETSPAILLPVGQATLTDGRGRFREVFCAVRYDHGAALPHDRPCEDSSALWKLPGEPPPSGRPVALGRAPVPTRVVMVPGLLAECAAELSKAFEDATANLQAQGYATGYIQTRGRQGSVTNADIIHAAVMAMPQDERIILVTHSKGTVDTLEALVKHPDLPARVAAVISVAGAVNGSPLADSFPEFLAHLAEETHLSSCPPGVDLEAVDSLRRSVRLGWLATHPLPRTVRTYSLAAFAAAPDMSWGLRPFYRDLAGTEPVNDGLVIASDAIIPGSTLLGYPNADHMAVAMPFGANAPLLAATLMDHNDYPRAVLLEAAVRYVQEDLAARPMIAENR